MWKYGVESAFRTKFCQMIFALNGLYSLWCWVSEKFCFGKVAQRQKLHRNDPSKVNFRQLHFFGDLKSLRNFFFEFFNIWGVYFTYLFALSNFPEAKFFSKWKLEALYGGDCHTWPYFGPKLRENDNRCQEANSLSLIPDLQEFLKKRQVSQFFAISRVVLSSTGLKLWI